MTSWAPASLANHLWQSTLLVVLVWLVTLVLRRHDARVRYWLWAAASLKFFLPFSWLISLGALVEWRAAPTIAQPAATFVMQEILASPRFYEAVPQVPRDSNIGQWFALGIWLAGTTLVFVWWGRQWRAMRVALRSATLLLLGPDCDAQGLTVMSSPSAFEPGVVGILRPVLLMPAGLVDRLTRPQLEAVLAHERAHIRAHDNFIAMVHMTVEAIFWFHPLVWWIERRMIDERERACDEAVIRAGKQPADYAEGILTVCRWSVESPMMCVSGVTGSDLRRRIETILANRLGRRLPVTGRVLLAGAALIVIGGPIGVGLLDVAAQQQTVATSQVESPHFEVASIRVNRDASDRPTLLRPMLQPGGRVLMRGQTLRDLIGAAYAVRESQLIGGPAWAGSTSFDLEARGATDTSADVARAMLRALLAERFLLVVHSEQRELPVYVMTRSPRNGHAGSQLRPAGAQCAPPAVPDGMPPPPPSLPTGMMEAVPLRQGATLRCQSIVIPGHVSARAASLDALATELANALGRPVMNRTGLAGEFDIDLRYAADLNVVADLQSSNTPGIATALQEQLGLRLDASRGPVDVLLIDRAAMPTEN
jgi:uncharacterized protein (TIGR03435 family)